MPQNQYLRNQCRRGAEIFTGGRSGLDLHTVKISGRGTGYGDIAV